MTFLNRDQLPFLGFHIAAVDAYFSKSVPADPFCNSWIVQNIGDVWVTVNGILLKGYPIGHPELTGAAVGVTGNYGEIYQGNINVQSAETTPGSGTTDFHVLIIQKCYNLIG